MKTTREKFMDYVALTNDEPLGFEPVRGEGAYLYDKNGKAYLDLVSGICVNALGHSHPAIIEAVTDQLRRYSHTMVYGEHVQSPQVELASKLASLLPDHLNNVYFTNSGTEATEGAMKLAKRATGRYDFVSARHSYHGSTQGSLSLNSEAYFTRAFRPLLPNVRYVNYNDVSELSLITDATAAVVIESVQGGAGYIPATKEFMTKLRKRCDEVGCLLILDEIQAAFGRTGTFWSFEQYGIEPDILLLGKALGGGLPLGAFIASRELMSLLRRNPALGHITSFGGNPVACAASLAMIEEIEKTAIWESIAERSDLFRRLLDHPGIRQISGRGFMLAAELDNFEAVYKIVQSGLKRGYLTNWFLFNNTSIRISPPLNISEEEIQKGCEFIRISLDEL